MPKRGKRGGVAALLAAAALSGCALSGPLRDGPRDVQAEVEALRAKIARNEASPTAHRQLAMLLVDPRNPARDYQEGLRELERYAALDPRGAQAPLVKKWLATLRALEELEVERSVLEVRLKEASAAATAAAHGLDKARREVQEMRRARDGLAKELAEKDELVAALRKENREMSQTIEALKALDLQMDRLRRGTR